ncbi:MAG: hypothetical protein AAGJ38_03320 [Planctomycetota bacterium]
MNDRHFDAANTVDGACLPRTPTTHKRNPERINALLEVTPPCGRIGLSQGLNQVAS